MAGIAVGSAALCLAVFLVAKLTGTEAPFYGNLGFAERAKFNRAFEDAVLSRNFAEQGFEQALFFCVQDGLTSSLSEVGNEFSKIRGLGISIPTYKTPHQDLASYLLVNRDGTHSITFGGAGLSSYYWELAPYQEPVCSLIEPL
ncbi:MAG: hypothetical protein AAGF29_01390 [Pseudomonadota bacterium]